MSITIAPVPSIGELISQWGLYTNNVVTGLRAARAVPFSALGAQGTATGTVFSTAIFPGVGYAGGMVAIPSASASIRPGYRLNIGNNAGGNPDLIPWCNLLNNPVAASLPDFRYTYETWDWMQLTVVSAADALVTGHVICIAGTGVEPSWGLGAGNPSPWWPNNPTLGFIVERSSPNVRAFLAPGIAPGTFAPIVDVDTGIPAAQWNKLGLTIARIGGNAVIQWRVNGAQVAEFRPVAPVPLYDFLSRWETLPGFAALRVSGASDDGIAHYWGGPGPSRLWLQTD